MAEQTFVGDRGVVHPMHPAIADAVLIASGKNLKAGTILKSGSFGALPAEEEDGPVYVLLEDVDTTGGAKPARCVMHGTVVRARLIDASVTPAVTASDALVGELPAAGIYPVQAFDYTKMA